MKSVEQAVILVFSLCLLISLHLSYQLQKEKLGVDYSSTLTSTHSLAFTCKEQGQNKEAMSSMRMCTAAATPA